MAMDRHIHPDQDRRIRCPVSGCAGTVLPSCGRHHYGDAPATHAACCDAPAAHMLERVADGPWTPVL